MVRGLCLLLLDAGRRPSALVAMLVPALALLSGCTDFAGPHSEGEVEQLRSHIKDGMPDTERESVVGFFHTGAGILCSGSLIAPNVVLTARHCVASTVGGLSGILCEGQPGTSSSFGSAYRASGFRVTFESTVDPMAGEFLSVEKVVIDPNASAEFCGNDLALLVLSDVVTNYDPMPMRLDPDEVAVPDELITAVGYGGVNNSGGAAAMAGQRRFREGIDVTCVEEGCPVDLPTLAGEFGAAGFVCQGDSGGPALDDQDRIIGVASRGTSDCDQSIYASTVGVTDFLKDAVVAASGFGLYEPPSWTAGSTVDRRESMPVGSTCSSPSDCPTSICQPDHAGDFCSRPCHVEAPCPEPFVCGGDSKVCERYVAPVYKSPPDPDDCNLASGSVGGSDRDASQRLSPWLLLLALGCLRFRRNSLRSAAMQALPKEPPSSSEAKT